MMDEVIRTLVMDGDKSRGVREGEEIPRSLFFPLV